MTVTVEGLNIYYERSVGEGTPIVIMHGWGCSVETVRRVFDKLAASGRTVIAFDFPGFGRSDLPPVAFSTFDYARVALGFFASTGIEKPDVIAHSFGGRVAIILASENAINRLLLVDAAGMKPRRGIFKRLKILSYKLRKRMGLNVERCGSADYRALSGVMRETFVRVVNEHLDKLLPLVSRPTLLVWGERDNDTPLYMAKRMNRKLPGSALIVIKNSGHFSFLDDTATFVSVAAAFFAEEQ